MPSVWWHGKRNFIVDKMKRHSLYNYDSEPSIPVRDHIMEGGDISVHELRNEIDLCDLLIQVAIQTTVTELIIDSDLLSGIPSYFGVIVVRIIPII